uniref:Shugoshin_C domain-containing protein n=1 Tax=Angiostrongylus cantonensis TaxID=6313 RepID=A0A0K0DPU6_ANGCA
MKAESSKITKRSLSPETLELIRNRGLARTAGNRQLTSELAKECRQAIKEDLKERRAAVMLEAAEAGKSIRKEEDNGNVSDDEDIVDEDDLEDDEQLFVPQPPTPDLLKSTRRGRGDERSTSYQNSPENQKRRFEKSDRREKRRSYTTSILISSHAERPMPITRQKSLGENTAFGLTDDDITVNVSKGQLLVGNNKGSKLVQRRKSYKEYSTQDLNCSSNCNKECSENSAHIINMHNVGDLFPGTEQDVSYV